MIQRCVDIAVGPFASMQYMKDYSKWYEVRTYVVGYHGYVCGM